VTKKKMRISFQKRTEGFEGSFVGLVGLSVNKLNRNFVFFPLSDGSVLVAESLCPLS